MTNVLSAMTRRSSWANGQPVMAAGKAKGKANKKARKKARQRCLQQVVQCRASLTVICADEPACLGRLDCCERFGACDAAGALTCLLPSDT